MLTAEFVRSILAYEPETGVLTWKVRRSNNAPAGSVAGAIDGRGYRIVSINGKNKLLGRYKTIEQASEAYAKAARETFGEYARTA